MATKKANTMRTVSENAAMRRAADGLTAKRKPRERTLAQEIEAEERATARGPTRAEIADNIISEMRKQVRDLMESNGNLQRHSAGVERAYAAEERRRRKVEGEIASIAAMLARCGDGELVISRMLFGVLRYSQEPDDGNAVPMEYRWVRDEDQKD